MSSKKITKAFVDDATGQVLDNLYRIAKEYSGSKKEGEKLVKYIIKTVIKVGILYRNDQFNMEEHRLVEQFKKKFRTCSMTVISFYEVDFSFDKQFLSQGLNECRAMLIQLVQRHLTEKSLSRIDIVFQFFSNTDFLEAVFQSNSPHRDTLGKIVADMHKMMENGNL